jgi:uncharacterized protein YbaP (TraB family)
MILSKTLNQKHNTVLFFVLFFFITPSLFGQKALLWKVSGNGLTEPSYLFGTHHLLGEKFINEVKEINEPFKNAKGVVVEMEIDSSKLMSVMQMAIMSGNKLSTLLSPEDFKLVSDELQKVSGFSLKMFDSFKPAQVSVLLMMYWTKAQNEENLAKYGGTPLDIYFASNGKKSGKKVTALETMEWQMKLLLDYFPVEEQAKQLVASVRIGEQSKKMADDVFKFYLDRDLNSILKVMDSSPKELGTMDHLLKERNEKWLTQLPAIMNSGSQFIAVGAGHLPGKHGILELLRQKGYTVEAVNK